MTIEHAIAIASQHHEAGRLTEAERIYRWILAQRPDHADALRLLGMLAVQTGRWNAAVDLLRRALRSRPDHPETHQTLGNALSALGRLDEAIAAYRQAVHFKPDYVEAHYNMGVALMRDGRRDDAIAAYRESIRLKPDFAAAHNNLGIALKAAGRFDEAIGVYRATIRLKPDLVEAHHNLANACRDTGGLDEAVAAHRHALQLKPELADAHSSLLMVLNYHPASDPRTLFLENRRWNQLHAEQLKSFIQPHSNDRDPHRPLRIGYVSSDFCDHASAHFLLPLLRHHDASRFDVTCYAQLAHPDQTTRDMQACVPHWKPIAGRTDADVAAMIRADKIDILVDLKLHTPGNRLLVFARKPAPVQVTWLGYPGTTGLDTIDYRLTDPHLDPPGLDDDCYSEQSIRLPNTFWCYDPLAAEPAVNPLPCSQAGAVTFGCLNYFPKVNDGVLAQWAKIMGAVSGSRLILLAPEGNSRQRVLDRLKQGGVGPQRVEFVAKQARADYLRTYHRIDIALDTFTCNGHTTSLDSFWMGVPVVTLAAGTALGRAGASQLSNLRLTELIARDAEQYVQIAVDLAADLPRLAELRRTLRARIQASPLMDAPRFARDVEAAYRGMWRDWCAKDAAG